MPKNNKKTYRHYTDEFKRSAVSLVLDEKRSVQSVGDDLGVSPRTLAYWVRLHERRTAGTAAAGEHDLRTRCAELEKENRTLKLERDILKKAAAFFAREHP